MQSDDFLLPVPVEYNEVMKLIDEWNRLKNDSALSSYVIRYVIILSKPVWRKNLFSFTNNLI